MEQAQSIPGANSPSVQQPDRSRETPVPSPKSSHRAAEVTGVCSRRCVELAGEEPDTPVEETVLAEHPKLQDCAIRGIMLRDEVSDQFAENGAPKVPPAPWRPS